MAVVAFPLFKELVGRKLGILAIGGSLSAEDGAVIGDAAETLQEQLDVVLALDFTSGIDSKYSDVLADMVAAALTDHFGSPEPRASRMRGEALFGMSPKSVAERRLRTLVSDEGAGPFYTSPDVTMP